VSGFLALLDDVAAIAKLAAAQVDDIAAHAAKAGGKSAGIVIDDAAVTPKYVTGLPAAREIPIVAKIAAGSLISKLAILLPGLLLLQAFAPGAIAPLLILGGAYLCFEGAEKIWHALTGHEEKGSQHAAQTIDAAHLEKQRVKGAIKTDFILSAEIMTIALSTINVDGLWIRGAVLAVIAVSFTVLVYGVVALLVKIDDIGLYLSKTAALRSVRALGRSLVIAMPTVLKVISVVGTAAMLWVGGSIVVHSLHTLHLSWPYELTTSITPAVTGEGASAAVSWLVTAFLDAVFGFLLGSILIPVVNVLLVPIGVLFPERY
jgi:predicted DNA repair protein MutK